jgi:hypothetical protein
MSSDDDDDDRGPFIEWGDLATLLLAAVFTLTGFYLIFGPSPFAGLKALHPPPPAAASREAPPPATSGEVTIGIGQGSTIHQPPPPDADKDMIKPPPGKQP